MSIANFRLHKLDGSRSDKTSGEIKVTSSFKIGTLKREKKGSFGDYILVNFEFEVKYSPDVGNIRFEGTLMYYNPELDKIIKETSDKIELNADATKEISEAILQRSLIESIDIAKKLNLPVPIRLPKVKIENKLKFAKAS